MIRATDALLAQKCLVCGRGHQAVNIAFGYGEAAAQGGSWRDTQGVCEDCRAATQHLVQRDWPEVAADRVTGSPETHWAEILKRADLLRSGAERIEGWSPGQAWAFDFDLDEDDPNDAEREHESGANATSLSRDSRTARWPSLHPGAC